MADPFSVQTGFFDHLGDDRHERPQPTMGGAIRAVGGVLVGTGLTIVAFEPFADGDGSRILGVVLGLVMVGLGYLALFAERPGLESAAIAIISIGVAAFVGFAVLGASNGRANAFLGLAALSYAVVYVVPFTRGRPVPLGLALAALWLLLVNLVSEEFAGTDDFFDSGTDAAAGSAGVSLVFGIACLAVVYALDRRGDSGVIATPFVVVGDVAYVVGVGGVLDELVDSGAGNAVLVLVASAALCWLGAQGPERRFTTWIGAVGLWSGAIALAVAVFDDTSSAVGPGLFIALLGLVAVAASYLNRLGQQAPAPVPAAAPAGWYDDPLGRYESRWFDGSSWGDSVRQDGETRRDPEGNT